MPFDIYCDWLADNGWDVDDFRATEEFISIISIDSFRQLGDGNYYLYDPFFFYEAVKEFGNAYDVAVWGWYYINGACVESSGNGRDEWEH